MSRHRHMEKRLAELADSVDWPEADVVAGVRRRIAMPPDARRRVRFGWKVAVAALGVVAAIIVVPGGRQAVADLLSFAGIEIAFTDRASRAGSVALELGEPTSLETASAHVDFPLALPALTAIGEPDSVYLEAGTPTVVHFTWDAGEILPDIGGTDIGLLLTEFAPRLGETLLTKDLTSDTEVLVTSVDGQEALWLQGAPHRLTYQTTDGTVTQQVSRLAANVLLWERSGVTYRLESALDLGAALRIAETIAVPDQ